ncbi:hypothetical protein FD723_40005 (plasmid) [Nostoc sp. C052]|uniref:hypothetical protein n=1 Tax=Nostoc sp. C052 TaxID=2576902 RepID=UPI0015C2F4D5|nr:hypothetical protein [Nostoc sp. C052]QLE46398.1 hypothetical protein FD723_40005 [Nostoc sp. C052]
MPEYRDTLELRFNYLQKARWEVFSEMPSVAEITNGLSEGEILRRDAWIFMVRQNGKLRPFYFDAVTKEVLPFVASTNPFPASAKLSYSQAIGDGINKEIIVTHNLGRMDLHAVVWQENGDRLEQINCNIFLLKSNLNQMGFGFAMPPAINEFIVVIS